MKKQSIMSGRAIVLALLIVVVALMATLSCVSTKVVFAEEATGTTDNIMEFGGVEVDMSKYQQVTITKETKINSETIDNFVPTEWFNAKNGSIAYVGEHYGFLLEVDNGRNRVLLFTIDYENTFVDDSSLTISISVVFQEAYTKTWFGINSVVGGETLVLGVPTLSSFIIDAEENININQYAMGQKGVFFQEVNYDGDVTNIENEEEELDATFAEIGISSSAGMLGFFLAAVERISSSSVIGLPVSIALTAADIIGDISYEEIPNLNNHGEVVLPGTRDGQIETFGEVVKGITIRKPAATMEYLTVGDNVKIRLRTGNPEEARYYVMNQLNFAGYKYTIASAPKQINEFSSISVFNMTEDVVDSENLSWQEGKLDMSPGFNLVPLVKGRVLQFVPQETGYYGLSEVEDYAVSFDGVEKNDEGLFFLQEGIQYKVTIAKTSDINEELEHKSVFIYDDFINGEIAFVPLYILRDQDLSLNDTALQSGLTYMPIENEVEGNNVYSIATSNTSDIEMYITDSEFNILAQGQKTDGKVVVNFPMLADEKYYLVCENKTSDALSMTLANEGDLTIGDTDYEGVQMYYRVDARYTQQYHFYGDVSGVFTAAGALHSDTGYDVFMQQGKSYYVLSTGADDNGEDLAVDFEDDAPILAGMGQNYVGTEGYNSVFEFVPKVTARYAFEGGKCDVYVDGAMTASAIDEALLEQGKRYTIVKCDTASAFSLIPDAQTIFFDQQISLVDAPSYAVFAFESEERMRVDIDISNGSSFLVCDSAMNVLDFDHGYYLMAAKYYIIVADGGDYTLKVKEYLQPIEIDLLVDGQPFADNSGAIYYYGKPFALPVPAGKVGYEFDGWFDGETAYTNAGGQSVRTIYADSITLEAHWTAKGVVIRMDPDTLESAWWTGDEIVYDEPEAIQEEGLAALTLVNLIKAYSATAEGRSEGYCISEFVLTQVDDDGENFYYVLEADFAPKKYSVTFALGDDDRITRTMTYGDVPTSAWEEEIFGGSNYIGSWDSWEMPLVGSDEDYETVEFVVGQSIPDLFTINTPMIEDEVYFPVTLTRHMNFVQYQIAIDGTTKTYDVDDAGCVLPQTIGELGLNEQNYYGYNVLFAMTQDDASFKYTMGATVAKSDLYRFWTDGATSVTVELAIEKNLIDYRIVYSYGRNDDNFNATKAPIILSDVSQRGWYFAGWAYNDQHITQIDLASIGEDKVYSSAAGVERIVKQVKADFRRTVYEASSFKNELTITSSVGVAYVDCYGVVVNVLGEFTIAPSVNEVTFDGGGAVWRDSKIVVQARTSPLTINFSGISIMAKSKDVVLDARDCMDLTIYSYNDVTLTSGEGGQEGQFAAIFIGGNLTLDGEKITIEGSDQTVCKFDETNYAAYGIIGGLTRHSDYNTLHVKAKNVYVYGGNGKDAALREDIDGVNGSDVAERGGDGKDGVDGGIGAGGIFYNGTLIVDSESYLYSEGGDGGDGTRGGHGGKGGPGDDGEWFGATAVDSGDGGNGGDGGDGGDGGWGIVTAGIVNNGTIEAVGGKGGLGGLGGNAGMFGDPGKTVFGNDAEGSNGDPGENGKNGNDGVKLSPS